jgi:hypothetical protein
MPGLTLQAVLIWFSCPILQLLCVYLLYRRKLLRQFAFFTSYLILVTLLNGVRFFCYRQFGFSSWAYYSVYWIGTALANMLVVAVLYELFCAAFKPFAGLQDLAKIVFKWAAGAMVLVGLVLFLSRTTSAPGAPYRWLASGILDFERIVSVMEIALLIFLFAGSQQVGMAMKTRVFGFALGFGFHAICNLLIYLALITSHVNKIPLWEQLLSEAYYVSLLIWVGYLLIPEPSSEAVQTIPVTSALLRWNEVAQQLGHSGGKVALFSPEPFLPQSERMVDRVMKEEFVERRRAR